MNSTVSVMGPKMPGSSNSKNPNKSAILLSYLFLGWMAVTTQTVVLREWLVVSLGNEIVFGLFLSCWLVGVFSGALVGGQRAEKTRYPLNHFIVGAAFFWILSLAATALTRASYYLSATSTGAYIPFSRLFLLAAVLIIPLGALIGYCFPLASRLGGPRNSEGARAVHFVSSIYIFEALGALGGGMVTSYYLLSRFDSFQILSLTALPLLALLTLAARRGKRSLLSLFLLVGFLIDLGLIIPLAGPRIEKLTTEIRWRGFSRSLLLETRDSRYQNLALGKSHGQYALYSGGHLAAVFPEEIDKRVMAAHLYAQHTGPERILIIGQAVDGLAQELLRFDIKKLCNIEIDEQSVRIIRKYLSPRDRKIFSDPRFSLVFGDGRRFVADFPEGRDNPHWDIIFLNLPEPSTLLLNRFYTREFFKDAAAAMAENGVLSLVITSSENYTSGIITRYTATVYHALRQVFPHVVVAPGFKNMFFASRSAQAIGTDPAILENRYRRSGLLPLNLGLVFHSLYPGEKTEFILRALEDHGDLAVNSDGRPIAIHHFSRILGWTSSGGGEKLFDIVDHMESTTLLWGFILLLLVSMALVFAPGRRKVPPGSSAACGGTLKGFFRRGGNSNLPVLMAVACGGVAGISLELLIIYSFQILYGYVYQLVGFIISLFMCGLPLGAAWARRRIRRANSGEGRDVRLLMVNLLAVAALAASFPPLLALLSDLEGAGLPLLYVLTVLVGFLIGAIFPLSLNIYLRKVNRVGRAAGFIDAADHLGAALGAFFCGAVLLPVLGITGVVHVVIAFAAVSVILLGLTMPTRNGGRTTSD